MPSPITPGLRYLNQDGVKEAGLDRKEDISRVNKKDSGL